jgi:hypothetical protein
LRLIVPYIGELQEEDARLAHLAEFLGLSIETLALTSAADPVRFLENALSPEGSCFVVNPDLMREWVGPEGLPAELTDFLLRRFSHLLVHRLRVNAFDSAMVAALSRGKLTSVEPIGQGRLFYEVSADASEICELFAGLAFGPVNPTNDRVFNVADGGPALRQLISIDGKPFMAALKLDRAEVLFVASEDVVSLTAEVGNVPLPAYFSRFVPHAMALRHAAGAECFRPIMSQASIIIDDPLLRMKYGFLNFDSLLSLANRHNFHAVIAFIPHNFKRNELRITRMFLENAERLSICFHGNDHTEAEFASSDPNFLNSLLDCAENRMAQHLQTTGLRCDRVLAFPQGKFSLEAMNALKSHNFCAAVNRVQHLANRPARLTIEELAQPAVLKYGGFPLYIRHPIRETQKFNVAFNLFFGRPVLIGEHHEIFENPDALVEIAARINSVAPGVRWSNLETVVRDSILVRDQPDGSRRVRVYAGSVRIANDSDRIRNYVIEWNGFAGSAIEQVLMDGAPCDFVKDVSGIHLSVELAPGVAKDFSLVHRGASAARVNLSLSWRAHAIVRRRLSEIRDNYLSKNHYLLTAAKALRQTFLKV